MLLKELSEACGIPGLEDEVRQLLRERLQPHVDEMRVDYMGNLIVRKGSGPVKVLLDAHMDEVGMMVKSITPEGFIKFVDMGGLDARVLPGRRVWVGQQRLLGVIGALPPHLSRGKVDFDKPIDRGDIYIDIGARDRADALQHVQPGDPIYFATRFEELSETVVMGKAFDDRVGCAVLGELLMHHTYEHLTLYGVFSVQEEVGLRGAGPAAFGIQPDMALALEGTTCANVPGVPVSGTVTELGKGPALSWMDSTTMAHAGVRARLEEVAAREGIPYQYRKMTTAGTNAGSIHVAGGGIPAAVISTPCRYIHTQAAMLNLQDFQHAIQLTDAFLRSLTPDDSLLVRA